MNWTSTPFPGDSAIQPIDHMGFDMIRAIVGARQAACATVRALHGEVDAAAVDTGQEHDAAIALLAGRRTTKVNGGAFARIDSADRSFPNRDECHG
jgi:hypothetical protein